MSIKLVFLGTGSGKPTPHRGVSSIALFRDGDLFLFDCGEGTQVQLARSPMRPGAIRAILLSHFHGDHVNGLPGLVGSLTLNQRSDPLTIVGPRGIGRWFKTLRELHIMWPGFRLDTHEVAEAGEVLRGDDFQIIAMKMKHRIQSWGFAFIEDDRPGRFDVEKAKRLGVPPGPLFGTLQRGESIEHDGQLITPDQVLGAARPGLKIVYTADTSPCANAIELARDADVLIHESTYPGGEEKLAHERGHSTCVDAARCAKEAGAKKLVLTHVSQRFPNIKPLVEQARAIFPNTVGAHDLMELEVNRNED